MTDDAIPARYNDGLVAATRAVAISCATGQLTIADAQGVTIEAWPADEVRLIDGPDAAGRVVLARSAGQSRVTVRDAGFAAALPARFPHLKRDPYATGISTKVIAVSLAGALVSLAVMLRFLLPFFAAETARLMPAFLEERTGRWIADAVVGALSSHDGRPATCDSAAGRVALDRLSAPLLRAADLKVPATIRVVRVPIINAFALPGSQVVLFSRLIESAQSPNEVAGVLAHELGHAELRHPTEVAIKLTASSYLIGLMFGDVFGAGTVSLAAQTLLGNAYTREAEAAADERAAELMREAGFDARPLADFFDRLRGERPRSGDTPSWLSTHPPDAERARRFRQPGAASGPALSADQWRDLKAICAPLGN